MTKYVATETVERELLFGREQFGLDAEAWDALLEDMIARAESAIERWAETVFETTDVEVTLNGDDRRAGGRDLPLPDRPARELLSVTVDDSEKSFEPDEDVYLAETHLELTDKRRKWPKGRRNITVEYTYGTDPPAELDNWVIRLVRNALDRIQSDGVKNESEGSVSYTWRMPAEVKGSVRRAVRQYKAPSYNGGAQVI